MVSSRHISIKVCGSPNSNSGFVPLILVNKPLFTLENRVYKGFDVCSSFFSITSDNVQTIYKLVMNKVRCYGVIRPGTSLVFGLAIPHGYKLDMGYTPYNILCRLRGEFVKTCLNCKDAERGIFEFRANEVNPNLFNNIVKEYTISPTPRKVVRSSQQSHPIAYIVKPEDSIEMLFHDTNYPEFEHYSEILIAEKVGETDYVHLNIEIPRRIAYSLIVDGKKQLVCTDIDKTLKVTSNANGDYFENKSLSFTIRQLIDGYFIPGVQLLEGMEEIRISTRGWAIPKKKKVVVRIVPQEYEARFPFQLLKISWPYGPILLNNDMCFMLEGEQIAELKKGTIKFSLLPNPDYILVSDSVVGDEIRLTIDSNKQLYSGRHMNSTNRISSNSVETHTPEVSTITILLHRPFLGGERIINLRLKEHEGTIATFLTKFYRIDKKRDVFVGHMAIPKNELFFKPYLCFYVKNKEYRSPILSFHDNKIILTEADFKISNISMFQRKRFVIILCIAFLLFLGGFLSGYVLFSIINNNVKDQTTKGVPENQDYKQNKMEQIAVDMYSANSGGAQKINTNYNCKIYRGEFKGYNEKLTNKSKT